MTKFSKITLCSLIAGAALCLTPAVKADEWDKKTVITINAPVEIPGKVLEPGTYVFKLADESSDRTIVQVFTEDGKRLVTTFFGVPDYRLDPPDKVAVTLEEHPGSSVEAIHSLFSPGDNWGVEFVYKSLPPAPVHEQPVVAAAAPAPAPAPVEVAAAPEPAPPAPEPAPVIAVEEEQVVLVAQEQPIPEPVPAPEPLPAELPKTAGNFAMIPLAGLTLLAGGLTALRFAARRS